MHFREQLCALIRQCRVERPIVAEIGVHRGRTSEEILRQFPGVTLYMVDAWREYEEATAAQQREFHEETLNRTRRYFANRHVLVMPSVDAAAKLLGQVQLDLVFIDASHLEDQVYADCAAWYPLVKSGGIFSGHDYGKGLGVDAAVDRFTAEQELTLRFGDGSIWWAIKP